MVLETKSLNKKAGKARVVKVKKKPSPTTLSTHQQPSSQPETAWKLLHPNSCNPKQMKELISGNWKFKNKEIIMELAKQYPQDQYKFYLFLGNEMSNAVGEENSRSLFPVINILIVPIGLNEIPRFLRRKAYGKNEAEIIDLHSLKLQWKPTEAFCPGITVQALYCDRSFDYIAKLPDHQRFNYEYSYLMDCRPSKAFRLQKNEKLLVEDAEFSVKLSDDTEVVGDYWKGQSTLKEFISGFIEDKGLSNDAETYERVKASISEAFAKKRKNAELQRERVLPTVSDVDLLEEVKCAKMFASNMAESEIGWKTAQTEHSYGPADHVF